MKTLRTTTSRGHDGITLAGRILQYDSDTARAYVLGGA